MTFHDQEAPCITAIVITDHQHLTQFSFNRNLVAYFLDHSVYQCRHIKSAEKCRAKIQ